MKKLIITQSQFIRLMENVKKLILDNKITLKDFILIKKIEMELNSHYIDLKEVFKEHNHKLCVNPQTIRKVLTDLHMDEEEEIIITGTYGDWGWFCNLLLSQVIENKEN